MAVSQAASVIEKLLGHGDNAITEQDITNPGRDRAKYADPSGEMMNALVWMGQNTVEVGMLSLKSNSVPRSNANMTSVQAMYPSQEWLKTEMSS